MSSGRPPELARSAFWKTAGQLLQRLRERQGWTYHELADRAGVTADLVVAYELARVRFPEIEACWRLTAALGVGLPTFLQETEKRSGVSLITGVRAPAGAARPPAPSEATDATEQDALSAFVRKTGGGAE